MNVEGKDADSDESSFSSYLDQFVEHMKSIFIAAVEALAKKKVSQL